MITNVSICIFYTVIVTIVFEADSQLTLQYASFGYINNNIH